jgi:GTPase SAR1 family protein
MKLPPNLAALQKALKKVSLKDLLLSGGQIQLTNPEAKHIVQYSAPGLRFGRPLDQTLIVLAGESGTGKSSTINRLFEDESLCNISATTSETAEVFMCTKFLNVTSLNPAIHAPLIFVDVPGFLDTDSAREVANFRKISNFRHGYEPICDREIPLEYGTLQLSTKVYPNCVLFVFNATNPRMDGPDSTMSKSLKLLKQHKLVDTKYPNLLLVGTHAAGLGLKPEKYEQHFLRIRRVCADLVKQIMGIENVPVILVENEPEDYNLRKDGDFYALPDGQPSHANLIEAMYKLFETANDSLAELMTSWYFYQSCPDKKVNATITVSTAQPLMADKGAESAKMKEIFDEVNVGIKLEEVIKKGNFDYNF